MQPYVNGYIDDLLLEIARYSGLKFEKVHANADTLLEGLRTGQYEAVLAALPPYTFNEAKYDFSDHFLTLGPVLITAKGSSIQKLEKIPEDNLVGVLQGDPAALFVQKQPGLILRYYSSTPELLDAVSSGTVTAALLDRIKACAYVSDLYQTTLQVSSSPLNNEGLHFLQPKGKDASFFRLFEKSLKALEEKQDALQKKWKLA
jgi:ABC-type amino acid transport substrate-binding protein